MTQEHVLPFEASPTEAAIEREDSGVLNHVLLQVGQSQERFLTKLTMMIPRSLLLDAHVEAFRLFFDNNFGKGFFLIILDNTWTFT